MSLKYAILGLLAGGPKHGYAIGRDLRRLLSGLWPVNRGQVYATLGRLASDQLVAIVPQPSAHAGGARARTLRPFTVLPAGRRALRRWLDRPVDRALPRSTLADQLVLHSWANQRDAIAHLLAAQRERCSAMHRLLEAGEHGDDRDLVARAARRHLEAELAWLTAAEQVFVGPERVDPTGD